MGALLHISLTPFIVIGVDTNLIGIDNDVIYLINNLDLIIKFIITLVE